MALWLKCFLSRSQDQSVEAQDPQKCWVGMAAHLQFQSSEVEMGASEQAG